MTLLWLNEKKKYQKQNKKNFHKKQGRQIICKTQPKKKNALKKTQLKCSIEFSWIPKKSPAI